MTTKLPTVDRVTDKYAYIQRYDRNGCPWGAPQKEKRFLCINGPLEGERRSYTELILEEKTRQSYRTVTSDTRAGYVQYNNGGSGPESMVYVWFGV